MAFRPTVMRSINISVQLAERLLDMKPEVEELMRRNVVQQVKAKYVPPNLGKDRKVLAFVVSGPHSGGSPESKAPDSQLHSTVQVSFENNKGEMQHYKTVHAYHDEEEYTEALEKVKYWNRLSRKESKERERKAEEKAKDSEQDESVDNAAQSK